MLRSLLFLIVAMPLLADPLVIPLYPGAAPGSEKYSGEEVWVERGEGIVDRSVANVDKPTLTAYLPVAEIRTGTAMVVAPGGAYSHLAIDKEGHDVGKWLASAGIAAFVLKYRLPRSKERDYSVDTALMDAQRAMRTVRGRASEWGIDAKRIGMMGFSAGGNLALLAGTRDALPGGPADKLASVSVRPDFLILGYPAKPADLQVDKNTPPAFLVCAHDDGLTPAKHSVPVYLAFAAAGVPAELHIYSEGGHGFGILNRGIPASSWPQRLLAWLDVMDFR